MAAQIFLGSVVLGICSSINILLMIVLVKTLRRFSYLVDQNFSSLHLTLMIALTFSVIVFAHTVQVWIWAGSLILLGALQTYSDAIYFSLVTYTTVGYGDVTLGDDFRIFGAMASVTGLLGFGISTAFLVEVLTRIFSGKND